MSIEVVPDSPDSSEPHFEAEAARAVDGVPRWIPIDSEASLWRQTTEFLVVLALCILLFRTFVAEAYIVPTGSMAPTLLGLHRSVSCTNCHYEFAVGVEENGRTARAVCPNCGQTRPSERPDAVLNGDRLLVHKFLFDLRPPRRWEVVVFQSPSEPNQAYVKRVIGLPGELVQVRQGDIWINGQIARKSLEEQRGMRLPLYDACFPPSDAARYPRWLFRRGSQRSSLPSGWSSSGTLFRHERPSGRTDLVDWLEYRHWDPDLGRYGPIRDFCPYNGCDVRGENVVQDLMLEADLRVTKDVREVVVRMSRGGDSFLIHLPTDRPGGTRVQRNGLSLELEHPRDGLRSSPPGSNTKQRLEVSVVDRRLIVTLDGSYLFDPYDFEEANRGPGPFATPIAIGIDGGEAEVTDLKLFRDIYYTSALSNTPRRPFGVDDPYLLGPDEYFVLGDNSPVSNDSRFWPDSPVVRKSLLIGKPFLVHLPGETFALRVFGRSVCWIPDPSKIRYIR